MTTHTLRRSRHHVALADRLAAPAPTEAADLAVRRALARPVDAEFALWLRLAVLEFEVTERLRAL
jgi:hypothetical protein